jgi:hypothetical protein
VFEIAIVETKAACELPDSFDGIKFWTVGWEKVQFKTAGVRFPPEPVESGMMIGSVVGNDHHAAARNPTGSAQLPEKLETRLPIKSPSFPPKHKTPVAQTDRAEISDTFAGRRVKQHRILDFWRNPRATTGTILLKMHFIAGPKIDAIIPS